MRSTGPYSSKSVERTHARTATYADDAVNARAVSGYGSWTPSAIGARILNRTGALDVPWCTSRYALISCTAPNSRIARSGRGGIGGLRALRHEETRGFVDECDADFVSPVLISNGRATATRRTVVSSKIRSAGITSRTRVSKRSTW